MVLLTYFCIALGGAFFLVLSALFGGDHDAGIDHDVDHDVGGDHGDHDQGGNSHHWLSLKVWCGFATMYGASGAIALALGANNLWAFVIAFVSGAVGAIAVDYLLSVMYKSQSNSVTSLKSLEGTTAKVTLPIIGASFGEVCVECSGSMMTIRASKFDVNALDILQGSVVRIEHASPHGMLVARLNETETVEKA